MNIVGKASLSALLLLSWLGALPAAAEPAAETPRPPESAQYSQRYTVDVAGSRKPLLIDYEKSARKLDRNRDRVLSFTEMAATAKELPGGLRVDLDDYVQGMAQEYAGLLSAFVSGYPSSAEIERQLRDLHAAHPDRVSLIALGSTPEGHAITAVRVALDDGRERPKLAVIAQQHAREWMAHQVALASLHALLDVPANADLLQAYEFWVVPMANPDGYEYSRDVDPMWRKNRRGSTPDEPKGVDLNRNFAAEYRRDSDKPEETEDDWGASDRPWSSQYRGSGPASEPETQTMQALLRKPGMVGVVDVHGFGCKIVLPNKGTKLPDAQYDRLATAMLGALGADYEILRYRDLYPVTGHLPAFSDSLGIAGITLEVGKAFQPNPTKIAAVSGQAAQGVLAFARALAGLSTPGG